MFSAAYHNDISKRKKIPVLYSYNYTEIMYVIINDNHNLVSYDKILLIKLQSSVLKTSVFKLDKSNFKHVYTLNKLPDNLQKVYFLLVRLCLNQHKIPLVKPGNASKHKHIQKCNGCNVTSRRNILKLQPKFHQIRTLRNELLIHCSFSSSFY